MFSQSYTHYYSHTHTHTRVFKSQNVQPDWPASHALLAFNQSQRTTLESGQSVFTRTLFFSQEERLSSEGGFLSYRKEREKERKTTLCPNTDPLPTLLTTINIDK